MTDIGHNSDPKHLRKEYVQRMVKLLEDVDEMRAEIRDLGKEMATHGVSPHIVKTVAREQMNAERRRKREAFQDELDQFYLTV